MDVALLSDLDALASAIVDSSYTYEQAVLSILQKYPDCPREILNKLVLVDLVYWSFDSRLHRGQLVLDKRLEPDVRDVFAYARSLKFPIAKIMPIVAYDWDDDRSMEDNNTSAFNYRPRTGLQTISNHAHGWAIDINPFLNPHIRGGTVTPSGAVYNTNKTGTILQASPIVIAFNKLGWQWGGDWQDLKDYQHFEKVLG